MLRTEDIDPVRTGFDQFHRHAMKTKRARPMTDAASRLLLPAVGLGGETGEYLNELKKQIRDPNFDSIIGRLSGEAEARLREELGDVLWSVAECCDALGFTMGSIALANMRKREHRDANGTILSRERTDDAVVDGFDSGTKEEGVRSRAASQ